MKKWIKFSLIFVFSVLVLSLSGFFIYVSDYYHAEDLTVAVVSSDSPITVNGNLTILSPSVPSETAFIFYPGAKVEHTAYIPLLSQLQQKGVTCILVQMPYNLAVFDSNAADAVFDQFPDIKNWYIGGHSLGGAMAGSYASTNSNSILGLILLGSYIYGDYPSSKSLTVYGSEDRILNKNKISYSDNVIEISGGNHAQFGNYGPQKGDGTASISSQEQQNHTVDAILEFMKKRNQ